MIRVQGDGLTCSRAAPITTGGRGAQCQPLPGGLARAAEKKQVGFCGWGRHPRSSNWKSICGRLESYFCYMKGWDVRTGPSPDCITSWLSC